MGDFLRRNEIMNVDPWSWNRYGGYVAFPGVVKAVEMRGRRL
jgi:hypothetical protein